MMLHPDTTVRLVNLSNDERLAALERGRLVTEAAGGVSHETTGSKHGLRQAIGLGVVRLGEMIQGAPRHAGSFS